MDLRVLDEAHRGALVDGVDVGDLVAERDAVVVVRVLEELRAEGGRNELSGVRQLVDHR